MSSLHRFTALAGLVLLAGLSATCAQAPRSPVQLQRQSNSRAVPTPELIQIPSPNQNERPAGSGVRAIVLHHTATADDARQVAAFFANPKAEVSSHYIVDRSGYIVQPVSDDRRAWHAGKSEFLGTANVNDFSIGIEICNLGDSKEPYSDVQYDAVIRLVAYLAERYQLPLERITRHRDVAIPKGRKIDTSDNFSVARVLDGIRALQNGSYTSPPASAAPAPQVPAFREVTVANGQRSLQDLADIYLDHASRWVEIQALNPQIRPDALQPGQRVKLPTSMNYWRMQ